MRSKTNTGRLIHRVILLILIVSLVLTSCEQKRNVGPEIIVEPGIPIDGYPSWYKGSLFDPRTPEAGEPLATYQIYKETTPKKFTLEILYGDTVIDQLITHKAVLKVTAISYDIIGEEAPLETKSEVICWLGMEGMEETDESEYRPYGIQRWISVMNWITNISGAVTLRMELTSLDTGCSTWYLHVYYIQYEDTVYFFKTYEEFYRYQIKIGYV